MKFRATFDPPPGLPEHGITAIELHDGRTLAIEGFYDQFAKWSATVELSDDEADRLSAALQANAPSGEGSSQGRAPDGSQGSS